MSNIGRDPKGYYIVLGITEDADADAIKSAFRSRAKRLHPDFNPSPVAAKQFNRLHEAYATLSDPKKRTAYDRPWKGTRANATRTEAEVKRVWDEMRAADEKAQAAAARTPEPKEKPAAAPRSESTTTQTKPEYASARGSDILIPLACRCGQITAQPRFVIYDMVWGRFGRVHRRSLSGVYCRSCADKTALRASFVSWVAGWWSWPYGPRETVRALINNIRGGRKPADRNARLLIRQARAFQKRGDLELARNAAEQAKQFARNPALHREIADLITSLGPDTGRVLKDRWARPGWAPMLQVLPLALIIGFLAATGWVSFSAPRTVTHKPIAQAAAPKIKPAPAPKPGTPPPDTTARQVYTVIVEKAAVHTGPAASFQTTATLRYGAAVTALEIDPRGDWVRVALPDNSTGFVALEQLRPDTSRVPDQPVAADAKP